MQYLNPKVIEGVSAEAFQNNKPYPWAHMQDTLTPEGWNELRATLPDMSEFPTHGGGQTFLRAGST